MPGRPTPRLLAILATAAGCADSSPSPPFATRDSAGVAMVDNHRPAGAPIRLDSAPLVDFSRLNPNLELGARPLARRLAGGTVVVADGYRLHWFEPGGRLLRTVGRQGAGPGEFRQIDLVSPFGDSLLVYD